MTSSNLIVSAPALKLPFGLAVDTTLDFNVTLHAMPCRRCRCQFCFSDHV